MKNSLKLFFIGLKNALFYSNSYIALCAVASVLQTLLILDLEYKTSAAFAGLVFFATVFIYAAHRLVSLTKLEAPDYIERFKIINANQKRILAFALIAMFSGAICFFQLKLATQIALLLPAVLSLAYVLPFIGQSKKRLRDLNFIKIALIAFVWAYVTVLLPLIEWQVALSFEHLLIYTERCLFIFAITLPFDIRDWAIDKKQGVLTIPAIIGVSNTKILGTATLLGWLILSTQLYSTSILLSFICSAVISAVLLWKSHSERSDFYYTGLVDGTILFQYILVQLFLTFY
jgi:4-hydroxybenzoate polyprenyltransferase